MIEVLRWGLWMSPIINSFLRPMGEPTWYNQDGAIRTVLAIFQDATTEPRCLPRLEPPGLHLPAGLRRGAHPHLARPHGPARGDAGEPELPRHGQARAAAGARSSRPAATARCIPEGVKRFTTWAPLLIPFYIPRGQDWDHAWSAAEAIRSREPGGLLATLLALPLPEKLLLLAGVDRRVHGLLRARSVG